MEIVTVPEAATELGISQGRVRVLIHLGKLKARKFGFVWAIARADLDQFKSQPRKVGRPSKKRDDYEN